MIRVVVDTNILVSGFFWPGAPSKLLEVAKDERIRLLASEVLIAELEEVLSRSKFAKNYEAIGKTAGVLVGNYRALVELVEPVAIQPASVDPDDDTVLGCAVGGKADCIVSGDNDLLRLKTYQNIPIWDVNRFLDNLEKRAFEDKPSSDQ